tara:strand:- start:27431 stop:28447 length:1017 start_codon:yes stop_codon:yes gene_type:complete
MAPSISVVIPVYNAEKTIYAAAQSVLEQSFTDFELLLVDDGSEDDSAMWIRRLEREDKRVKGIFCPHRGVSETSNTGFARAKAPFIARLDADDLCAPTRLAAQYALLQRKPNIGVCSSLVAFGGDRDKKLGYALYVDWLNTLIHHEDISRKQFVESPIANPSVMFRTALYHTLGGYRDGDFPEDYELWLRWLQAGVQFEKVPEYLLQWNDPPGRLSRTDQRYSAEAFHRCKAAYLAQWLSQHNPFHPHIKICGAGRKVRKHSAYLKEQGIIFTHYIDIDHKKVGNHYDGVETIHTTSLPPPGSCFLVSYLGGRDAKEEVKQWLADAHYQEGKDFILAA